MVCGCAGFQILCTTWSRSFPLFRTKHQHHISARKVGPLQHNTFFALPSGTYLPPCACPHTFMRLQLSSGRGCFLCTPRRRGVYRTLRSFVFFFRPCQLDPEVFHRTLEGCLARRECLLCLCKVSRRFLMPGLSQAAFFQGGASSTNNSTHACPPIPPPLQGTRHQATSKPNHVPPSPVPAEGVVSRALTAFGASFATRERGPRALPSRLRPSVNHLDPSTHPPFHP